ncbi:MAG TPA: hypothetical protein VNO55_08485 [Polyangia bacterium]|nr:hypothetical protein [Polyangia bacterium]
MKTLKTALIATALSAGLLTGGAARATTATRLSMNSAIVAAGPTHALFVSPSGQVWAWGSNLWGQLGDFSNSDERMLVQAAVGNVLQVAAGQDFSLAVDAGGTLYSWGRNDLGQLGNGATSTNKTQYVSPNRIDQSGGWRSVAAGTDHAVGIKFDGTLWGWGTNGSGQLCRTSTTFEKTPVQLGTKADWLQVAAGKSFTVGIRADGTLWGCGTNANGQMDTGAIGGKKEALFQLGTGHYLQVAAGTGHVVAIRQDGTLWSWGMNDKLQAGTTGANVATETRISSNFWRFVSAGDRHTLGVKADGTMWGWGDNTNKELAHGDLLGPRTPVTLSPTIVDGQYIFAGKSYSVMVRASGELNTLGLGSMCGIGAGASDQASFRTPVAASGSDVAFFAKPGLLSAGTEFAMAIASNGQLQSWGANLAGQLLKGHQQELPSNLTVQYVPASGKVWVEVSAAETHGAGITSDGTLWTWGGNSVGQLGTGGLASSVALAPVSPKNGTLFRHVVSHYAQTFGITPDGKLWAWGDNADGQLAIADKSKPVTTPVQVAANTVWSVIAAAPHTTYGIDTQGRLYAWGDGTVGQRGDGTVNSTTTPTPVAATNGTNTNWIAISAGDNFAIGLQSDGTLWGFGANDANQLGNASLGHPVKTPQRISTRRFTFLATARVSTLAQSNNGEVYGWGANSYGQLGTEDTAARATPTLTLYSFTTDLTGGAAFFIQNNGQGGFRFVTGANTKGQLGLGWKDDIAPTVDPTNIPGSH